MPDAKDKISRAAFLAQAPIFADLTENELGFLANKAVAKRFSGGEIIFSEGDPCAGLYVIETGFVKIFKSSASGREQVLAIDGPGHSVAELPVFDGGKYPASGMAVQDTVLLFVSKQDFQALCLEHPQVALKVLRVVGRRLRGLVAIIEELSFTTVRHRLASLLLRLTRNGRKSDAGIEFDLPVSNQEIASQIGTVRELVSRNMSRLQAAGIIRMDGRTVVVPDVRALEAEVEAQE
jgi:CRP/FNR family transcriptional regulator